VSSTPSDSVFALVDGNAFYVSCEGVFNVRLRHQQLRYQNPDRRWSNSIDPSLPESGGVMETR
jgi:hypothetical protein